MTRATRIALAAAFMVGGTSFAMAQNGQPTGGYPGVAGGANGNPFRPGIARILRETPATVVPMALGGLWGSLFSRSAGRAFLKRPRKFWALIDLAIGPRVPPAEATPEQLQAVVAGLRGERR